MGGITKLWGVSFDIGEDLITVVEVVGEKTFYFRTHHQHSIHFLAEGGGVHTIIYFLGFAIPQSSVRGRVNGRLPPYQFSAGIWLH